MKINICRASIALLSLGRAIIYVFYYRNQVAMTFWIGQGVNVVLLIYGIIMWIALAWSIRILRSSGQGE